MYVETALGGALAIFFLSPSGQRNEKYLVSRRQCAQALRNFNSVHSRHSEIQKYDVWSEAFHLRYCVEATVRDSHVMPVELK